MKMLSPMKMMDAQATELFNATLRAWRREGRRISWPELRQAADLAQADQEAREAEEREA